MKITSRQIAIVFGRPTGSINTYARKHGYESTESTYEYQQTPTSKVVTYPCLEFDVLTAVGLCYAMFPMEKDKVPAEWKAATGTAIAQPVVDQRNISPVVSLEAVADAPEGLTMSSREIAELTNKEHYNVLKDVRAMLQGLQKAAVSFEGSYFDPTGRELPMFKLPKDLTFTLVAGYDVQLRHKIVTRWMELEAQVKPSAPALPNFTNPAEAAIAWAEQWKAKAEAEKLVLEQKQALALQAPKVEALKRISEGAETMTVTNAAKVLQMSPKTLFQWLSENKWIYRNSHRSGYNWMAYQAKIEAGVLKHKMVYITDTYGSGGQYIDQVIVTRKGLTALAEKLV